MALNQNSRRGFAAMDGEQRREIASMGGRAAHEKGTAHKWDEEEAAEAGRKGGKAVSRDRAHMAAIGRKGGQASQAGRNGTASEDQG
jgi:general stress protein YciG